MSETEDVFEKLQNNSLRSYDFPLLLKRLRQDARNGRIELTPEDVEWFEVYEFTLQQLDLRTGNASSDIHPGDWRGTAKDFSKIKAIIDEMEENGVVTDVNWNVGSLALFTIPNQAFYRRHICCLITSHLGKLYGNL
ncbi:MAG: hypothetical protein SCH66_11305 [Methanolobus sp.]|nr:hypothetical protein [Methanolobus sp.]